MKSRLLIVGREDTGQLILKKKKLSCLTMTLRNFSGYPALVLVMTRSAIQKMNEKDTFGELTAKIFDIGDIVEWSTWNRDIDNWNSHYGIVIDIKNEIKSGRLVSISTVKPVSDTAAEIEFFTVSLKLISKSRSVEKIQ